MKKIYGKVAVVVKTIKRPSGAVIGKRVYALAHPPVTRLAFGAWPCIDAERSTILKWSNGDDAGKMMAEMQADGYEPYMAD